ncbi:3-phosphoshikimate 1-carboxyvinyltransferase [Candidatus Gracilibacteria bacterium]|nr:3-phosphoshikimate 1-carboxyvinyltransferase [Candidatus Gracilibacteria bacterium]
MIKKISVPGSKSVSVRAVFLAALSKSPTVLRNVLECDDTRFLMEALVRLGVGFDSLPNGNLRVSPPKVFLGNNSENFIGNAGTPARFLGALSLLTQGAFSLHGVDRMHERPFEDLFDAVRSLGVQIKFEGQTDFLPAQFTGPDKIQKNSVSVSGSVSSQFLSGLLLVAPRLPEGLTIEVTDEIKSRPYVEMTLEMLKIWGVKVEVSEDFQNFRVAPGLCSPGDFSIPADCSSASYPIAWALLSGTPLCIKNYGTRTLQGDEKFLDVAQNMGAKIHREGDTVEISPPVKLRAIGKMDFSTMPDVSMTAMTLAMLADGVSEFHGVESLRLKECDRIAAMEQGIRSLGGEIEIRGDIVTIIGRDMPWHVPTEEINSFDDHRIAMVFGILRSVLHLDFLITDEDCVSKSWPDFWLHVAEWEGALRSVSGVIVEKPPLPREIPQSGNISRGKPPLTKGGNMFLIVKKPRKSHAWQFPQGGTENGENGINTAKRELEEECGSDLRVRFNPEYWIGEYRYFFPKGFVRHKPHIRGARTRFFRAEYVQGEVKINTDELEDCAWVTKDKLPDFFEKDYWEAVQKFLGNFNYELRITNDELCILGVYARQ